MHFLARKHIEVETFLPLKDVMTDSNQKKLKIKKKFTSS